MRAIDWWEVQVRLGSWTFTRTKLSPLPFQSICQSHPTRHRLIPATLSSPPRFRILWSGSNPSRPPAQDQSIQLRTTVDDRCWPFGFSHLGSLRRMLHRQNRLCETKPDVYFMRTIDRSVQRSSKLRIQAQRTRLYILHVGATH